MYSKYKKPWESWIMLFYLIDDEKYEYNFKKFQTTEIIDFN